jgi:hypothetical protein
MKLPTNSKSNTIFENNFNVEHCDDKFFVFQKGHFSKDGAPWLTKQVPRCGRFPWNRAPGADALRCAVIGPRAPSLIF